MLDRILRAASPFNSTANRSGIADHQESLNYCLIVHLWKILGRRISSLGLEISSCRSSNKTPSSADRAMSVSLEAPSFTRFS